MAKVLELQLQHPSSEYSGLISFRTDWSEHGTLNSLLQHHSSEASGVRHSAFFMFHLSHLYVTNGVTIALTIQPFVGKVMSLLFNTLSRFVRAFLPISKCLLISWLQSRSSVILEPNGEFEGHLVKNDAWCRPQKDQTTKVRYHRCETRSFTGGHKTGRKKGQSRYQQHNMGS